MTVRYGLGLHEVRDIAISLSQKTVSQGFNPESADYFAGHTVDPLGYMLGSYFRDAYYKPSDLPPNWDEWRCLAYQRAGYRCQRFRAYGVPLEAGCF